MLKNTIVALALIGCASPNVVKEQGKEIEALKEEIKQLSDKADSGDLEKLATSLKKLQDQLGVKIQEEEPSDNKEEGQKDDSDKAKKATAEAPKEKPMTDRLAELEAKLVKLQANAAKGGRPGQMSPEDQKKIQALMKESQDLQTAGKNQEAAAKLKEILKISPQMGRRINAMITELEVVGKAVSGKLKVGKWLKNSKSGNKINLSDGVTFVIFWELWCPHCKREIPNLEKTYKDLKGKGLQMVGLTTMSRDKSEKEVKSFLKESKVTYPVATHDGSINKTFAVGGIPAAALVKDGKIIWRGHPARLSKEDLQRYL